MRVVSSSFTVGVPQADGRVYVTELHLFDTGIYSIPREYLAEPDLDFQAIADQRAANMNAEFARREAEFAEAMNFEAPISVRQFLELIPPADRIALRSLAKTNAAMDDALQYLNSGPDVYKPVATAWLQKLVTAGVVQQSVVDGVLTEWAAKYG